MSQNGKLSQNLRQLLLDPIPLETLYFPTPINQFGREEQTSPTSWVYKVLMLAQAELRLS